MLQAVRPMYKTRDPFSQNCPQYGEGWKGDISPDAGPTMSRSLQVHNPPSHMESHATAFGCLTSSLGATTLLFVGYSPWLRATPLPPPQRVGEDGNRGHQRPSPPGLTGGKDGLWIVHDAFTSTQKVLCRLV